MLYILIPKSKNKEKNYFELKFRLLFSAAINNNLRLYSLRKYFKTKQVIFP